jgi:hypothetical protein
MFHAAGILGQLRMEATAISQAQFQLNSVFKNTKGRTCVRPSSDEVYTPSLRRSEGQCGQLWRALFAPHCEQNLYANPKRTAKSFLNDHKMHDTSPLFKKYFLFVGCLSGRFANLLIAKKN